MILAGDVGGTKVNLALFEVVEGTPQPVAERSYVSRDYPDCLSLLEQFLKETQPKITHACLGVAGPVKEGRCSITHLPWTLDVRDLKQLFNTDSVFLINDLAAMAHAVPCLSEGETAVIQPGQGGPDEIMGVLAAGTGLGQAFLIPESEGRYRALETEGGQCDFAPRTELEAHLFESIRRKAGRVCIEDILSGPGLIRLYEFFKERNGAPEPRWLADDFQKQDPATVISQSALAKKSKTCESALELFVSICGAVAGNLALQILARGGIYLGGGIAPEILPLLQTDVFLEAFRDKGEFRDFMMQVPVKVIMNKRAPLFGSAYFALGEKVIR